MSNSEITRLTRYAEDLKSRLHDLKTSTPAKHASRPREFKQYLENELKTVSSQLEKLRLEAK